MKLSLSLPLSVAEFDLEKQAKFKEAIARAAGASPADVAIDNIEASPPTAGAFWPRASALMSA